jgi:flavorubredoxin
VKKRLLLIYSSQTGRTEAMMRAVCEGIEDFVGEVDVRVLLALEAGIDDLLWAEGLLIGTPENFGYMSGAVKDFMDRTYYPAEGKVDGLPFALFVAAGNDGSGAVRAVERIALGYRWTAICDPLVLRGEIGEAERERCRELGRTMAAGLAVGMF